MKRTLLTLVLGIALGSAGVAAAAASLFWSKSVPRVYSCSGNATSVRCKTESYTPRYAAIITRSGLVVYFGSSQIFICPTKTRPFNCADIRR